MSDNQPTFTEYDKPDPADTMADRIAADLFWNDLPAGTDFRFEIQQLAEQVVADGREATPQETDMLRRRHRRVTRDLTELDNWLLDRKAIEYFGSEQADLISQVKFMRLGDILVTAAVTAFLCTLSTGVLDILRSVGVLLRHLV